MKLLAGGCSLIYGSELHDEQPSNQNGHSQSTFPALLAKHLNLDYVCCARPGYGSDAIVRNILTNIDSDVSLVIVNWSYADRFEFYFKDIGWQNLKYQPGESTANKVPENLRDFRRMFYSELTDEYSLYQYVKDIVLAQEFLKNNNIPYIFSSAADNIISLDRLAKLGPSQHKFYSLIDFEQWFFWPEHHAFVPWTEANHLPQGPDKHPLEQAHFTTFEMYKDFVQQKCLIKGLI